MSLKKLKIDYRSEAGKSSKIYENVTDFNWTKKDGKDVLEIKLKGGLVVSEQVNFILNVHESIQSVKNENFINLNERTRGY